MSKTYTSHFKRVTNSVSANSFPLIALEIDRDDLAQPIRIINDTDNLTVQGNEFIAMPFNISLPDDPEQGIPSAQLTIDNVGRELTMWIEGADWSQETTCRIIQVMRDQPNTIEWEITMVMSDISMTSRVITAKLSFEDFFGSAGVAVRYTPTTFVGLF